MSYVRQNKRTLILAALELHNYRRRATASSLRMKVGTLREHVKRLRLMGHDIPADPDYGENHGTQTEPDPTPEEIAAQCAKFRESWCSERLRRYESPPVVCLHAFTVGRAGRERIYNLSEL